MNRDHGILSVALVAAVMVATAAPASAADNRYFQEFRQKTCPSDETCVLDFPKIGKDKLARLSNVSCSLISTTPIKFMQMDIIRGAFVIGTVTLKPSRIDSDSRFTVANDHLAAFVEAGQNVRIRAEPELGGAEPGPPGDGEPDVNFACHVAGSY